MPILHPPDLFRELFPKQFTDPDREWVQPGHAKPTDEHGINRVLFRVAHAVQFEGRWRPTYTLIWSFGHQTDVWHTYPKKFWTEEEVKRFHDARQAHAGWTAPNPHSFRGKYQIPELSAAKKAEYEAKRGK